MNDNKAKLINDRKLLSNKVTNFICKMKVLIVEDQISIQFKLVEQLQTHIDIQNKDIQIASNGLEAIKIVEQNNLDIILMDLKMPVMDGLTTTSIVTGKYPEIKIIIITGYNDITLLQKSLDAGAKGYLLKENITTNLIPLIHNIINGYNVFPELKFNSNNLSSEPSHIIIPEQLDKILKIDEIIALEILESWIYDQVDDNLTEKSFLEFLDINLKSKEALTNLIIQGSSPKCNLVEELDLRLDQLESKYLEIKSWTNDSLTRELELIINKLNYWFYPNQINNGFSCFQQRLQVNAQALRTNISKRLKDFIDSFLFNISPRPCLEYLESLETLLNNTAREYQNELEKLLLQEQSACNAYDVIFDINFQSICQDNIIQEFDSLIRALSHIYRAKIKIEAYNLVIQTLEGMMRIIQFYIDDLVLTNNLLENIKNQLDIFDVDQSISLFIKNQFIFSQYSTNLLQEIETDLGHSLNQWGIFCHINSNLIIDMLIAKISNSDIKESINQKLSV